MNSLAINYPSVSSVPISPSLIAVNRPNALLPRIQLARTQMNHRMALSPNLAVNSEDAVKAQKAYQRLFTVTSHFILPVACSSNSSDKADLPNPISNINELVNRVKTYPQSTEEIDKVVCALERVISSDLSMEQIEDNFAEKLNILVRQMKEILEKINGKILWGRKGIWKAVPPNDVPSSLRENLIVEIAQIFERVKKNDKPPCEARKINLTTYRLNTYKTAFFVLEAVAVDTSVRGQIAYGTLINNVSSALI